MYAGVSMVGVRGDGRKDEDLPTCAGEHCVSDLHTFEWQEIEKDGEKWQLSPTACVWND